MNQEFQGWQLDFQHRLDPRAAILYLGNGKKVDLKNEIPVVQSILEFEEDLPISIASDGVNMVYVGTNSAVYEIDISLQKVNIERN